MRIHEFDGFTIGSANVHINLKMDRFTVRFNRAQYRLDSMVMTSMVPRMPFLTGAFINETKAKSAAMAGTGQVCAGVSPQGRFLYEGQAMVGEKSRSAWAKKGEKKVTTGNNLTYSNGRQSHWFDAAKDADGDNWVRETKRIAGGG